jgi:hypothetical protein
MLWKKYPPGPRMVGDLGKGDCVDGRILIPWLKMDRKTDALSSCNGSWKFGKRDYI